MPISLLSKINVIQGDLGNEEGLEEAAACGADISVSLAGSTLGKREGTVRYNYPKLLLGGRDADCRRLAHNNCPQNPLPPPQFPNLQTHPHSLQRLILRPPRLLLIKVHSHQLLHQSHWRRQLPGD
jgi:hypothetical protein